MLVEHRTYTTHPGKFRAYLELYERRGLEIQKQILGRMVGYYYTEIGSYNEIVHLWAYESLQERTDRRALLMQNPEWQSYISEMFPLLQKQETKILTPAPFFQPQWNS